MKTFTFTVDDNIRFLRDLTERSYSNIFDHPYLALYKRLHRRFGVKVQLNLFYRTEDFDLSMMTDRYAQQWLENAPWLKLSFHSDVENEWPYMHSGYDEVRAHCSCVNENILRFASERSLALTTTVHYCSTTEEGVRALKDNGVKGLLGLFGTEDVPRTSYALPENTAEALRAGQIVTKDNMTFAPIDIILNTCAQEEILQKLDALGYRQHLCVMIHEQYFYPDYPAYQPDFEEKLTKAFSVLCAQGRESRFFEEMIPRAIKENTVFVLFYKKFGRSLCRMSLDEAKRI